MGELFPMIHHFPIVFLTYIKYVLESAARYVIVNNSANSDHHFELGFIDYSLLKKRPLGVFHIFSVIGVNNVRQTPFSKSWVLGNS